MSKDSVRISGIWLIKTPARLGNKIEVLVEVDGTWRRAISEVADEGSISHISEPAGMRTAPVAETWEAQGQLPTQSVRVDLANPPKKPKMKGQNIDRIWVDEVNSDGQ